MPTANNNDHRIQGRSCFLDLSLCHLFYHPTRESSSSKYWNVCNCNHPQIANHVRDTSSVESSKDCHGCGGSGAGEEVDELGVIRLVVRDILGIPPIANEEIWGRHCVG